MHMIFKNKLIIYITPPILSPTQFEYPSFGELEMFQWGGDIRQRWICLDFILSLCRRNTPST